MNEGEDSPSSGPNRYLSIETSIWNTVGGTVEMKTGETNPGVDHLGGEEGEGVEWK